MNSVQCSCRTVPVSAGLCEGRRPRTEDRVRSCTIRLLIADAQIVFRKGLVSLIGRQHDMTVVAEADNGRAAVDLWRYHRPDVALIELGMPVLDGAACIAEIRTGEPSARLIILTAFDGEEDIYRGMRAGAKAYLRKDVNCEQLIECIRGVNAGQTFVPPAIAAKLAARVADAELTARETEVLGLLATGQSNKEIGQALRVSEATVKSHVKAIFAKLSVASRTEAVTTAGRRGLIRI